MYVPYMPFKILHVCSSSTNSENVGKIIDEVHQTMYSPSNLVSLKQHISSIPLLYSCILLIPIPTLVRSILVVCGCEELILQIVMMTI